MSPVNPYNQFLERKTHLGSDAGFDPVFMPSFLFPFQQALTAWAVRKGRAAIFADCGMGKTAMQLVWAQNVVEKTSGRVLILTPLAVGAQTVAEGSKFGIECSRSRDGSLGDARITVANYEQLHKFNPQDFSGIVCDESSILKNFDGETKKAVTRFMLKLPYRLLCTATAAPNDYVELGTSSEALGELGYTDMISRFFVATEKIAHRMQQIKEQKGSDGYESFGGRGGNHFAKLSFRVHQSINKWTLKGHAKDAFWKWVCSWARACRMPSDLGFDDGDFVLPSLIERDHSIEPSKASDGMLFTVPAIGLSEEREERRRTLQERCEFAAQLAAHNNPAVLWCHFNTEGDLLERLIPDAVQVSGALSDEEKEEHYTAFSSGQARALIIKPKIGAFGLNWQHCAHVITFATHSYEQYYQAVRRCWRFGQKLPVTVDIISTTGELYVRENMRRKAADAGEMFKNLVTHMNDSQKVSKSKSNIHPIKLPVW